MVLGSELPAGLPNPIHPSFIDRLDEDFINYYNENIAIKPASHSLTIEENRANPAKNAGPWCKDYSYEHFVENRTIPSKDGSPVKVRIYHPDQKKFGKGPFPVHVNYHGGGFCFGDLTSDAEYCMLLRNKLGIIAFDVDYRLTPEHQFGKNIEDAWAAVEWIQNNGADINANPSSVSVGGISAGGFLAAVIQQIARDKDVELKLAILAVPCTIRMERYNNPLKYPWGSLGENALAPTLNAKRLDFFADLVRKSAGYEEHYDKLPIFWKDPIYGSLEGVCDTFVVTASCDPIRDDGEAYAAKLIATGTKVTARRYTGVPHPFMHYPGVKKKEMYDRDTCDLLKIAHDL